MSSPDIILLAENDEYALYSVQSESNPDLRYGVDIKFAKFIRRFGTNGKVE